jgi:uncharacterized membrane protein
MTLGPLEYVVIEFEGNHFTGEILPELRTLRDEGVMRIIDLVFIQKDNTGTVSEREVSELSLDEVMAYRPIAGDLIRAFSSQDIDDVARDIPNGHSAALALLEHTWAPHLRNTILNARGKLLKSGLLATPEIETLEAELAADAESAQA